MRPFLFIIVCWLSIQPMTPATAPDEIDKAVAEGVSQNQESWGSGMDPSGVDLPADASPAQIVEQVAKQADKRYSDLSDQFKNYRIVQVKQVVIRHAAPEVYTAILIASAKGSKTLILTYYTDFNSIPPDGFKVVGVSPRPNDPPPKLKPKWWYHAFPITTAP
jgi:hypothetical protein